jgi:hypothetical protein
MLETIIIIVLTTIMCLMWIVPLLFLVYLFWALRCNSITHKQRMMILRLGFLKEGEPDGIGIIEDISYSDHLDCVMRMQNPFRLYKIRKPIDK